MRVQKKIKYRIEKYFTNIDIWDGENIITE